MQQNPGVGGDVALPLRSRRQEELPHGGGHPHADGHDVGLDELHRVVDRHARRDRAAGRVDVQVDVLLRILGGQQQQLSADDIRVLIAHLVAEPDDALLQEAVVDRVSQPRALLGLALRCGRCAHALSFPSGPGPVIARRSTSRCVAGSVDVH